MEKTLTFTVEDALLSPLGFSILSGAGLFNQSGRVVHVHQTTLQGVTATGNGATTYYKLVDGGETANPRYSYVEFSPSAETIATLDYAETGTDALANLAELPTAESNSPQYVAITSNASTASTFSVNLTDALQGKKICADAPIFFSIMSEGSIVGTAKLSATGNATENYTKKYTSDNSYAKVFTSDTLTIQDWNGKKLEENDTVAVDYYILEDEGQAMELQINAQDFAGTYYVEADTLVRKQSNGADVPAIITLPNVKIQSNFTFTMASSGDPSTFTFTMDAMPGYTYFNKKDKVLCVMQIVNDEIEGTTSDAVMRHGDQYSHDTEVNDGYTP